MNFAGPSSASTFPVPCFAITIADDALRVTSGADEPSCLPVDFPIMPHAFKKLGYQTHMTGGTEHTTPPHLVLAAEPWRIYVGCTLSGSNL